MVAGHETTFLQETVGSALARGCAATVAAQPNDPVEYLGLWLLRYVKKAEIEAQYVAEKEKAATELQRSMEERNAALQAAEALAKEKKKNLELLASLSEEPRKLLERAVALILRYTTAGSVYAAALADTEEPDLPPAEEEEGAEDSEDETLALPPEPPAEEEGVEIQTTPPPTTSSTPSSTGRPLSAHMFDYSKKHLAYVVASPGQDFVTELDLRRPLQPEDGDVKAEPVPYTFRVLDEKTPMMALPNVSYEPSIKFFRQFPKIGAYYACAVQLSTGEYKSLLCLDTLLPEGNGQPLPKDEQDFVWDVCVALGKAFDGLEKQTGNLATTSTAAQAINDLRKVIHNLYHPPPPPETEGAEDPNTAAPATEPIPDGAPDEPQEDPWASFKAEITALKDGVKAAEGVLGTASDVYLLEGKVLLEIMQAVYTAGPAALDFLRRSTNVPQSTYHMLKAALYLLGKDPSTFNSWKKTYNYFTEAFLEELTTHNADKPIPKEMWSAMKGCYKAVTDLKTLESEMPGTHWGLLLRMLIKQVRKVSKKSADKNAAEAALEAAQQLVAQKEQELEDAKVQKAKEEEEAAKLAEEAAAAEAAAAESGEGGEGGETVEA